MKNFKYVLFGLLFLFLSSALFAFDGYVIVTNETGYDGYYLYVSHEYSDSWEEDVLGSDVLMDGDSVQINLSGYETPYFDIRLEDEDGDTYTRWGVDVSMEDVTFTWEDLDMGY